MSSKADRRAARETVAAYHEAELARLLQRVGEAIDAFRSGQLDAFEVDQVLFQYSRAAKELWRFCNIGSVELTASLIKRNEPSIVWWDRGAPKGR
ncbi:hypothetical protein [Ornithinimicrobium sediminis]|uniref:hypothetical protein n=1 Tax=Ornithinimicrobium sediminis TaxID=2904603 RepID=UPI001E5F4C05|nr:hypothetical protein [Ornithinimicrobium sediminis]MCE0485698.1 hypothetical protein [Ornithinimicrobium sediminis]